MGGKDKKFSKKIGVGSSYTSTAVQDPGQECVLCYIGWAGATSGCEDRRQEGNINRKLSSLELRNDRVWSVVLAGPGLEKRRYCSEVDT